MSTYVKTFMLLLCLCGSSAFADTNWLEVIDRTPIYSKPEQGKPALFLEPGETVPISEKTYGNGLFYRVIINFKGKKRGGYILASDVDTPPVKSKNTNFTRANNSSGKRRGWGLSYSYQLFKQGSGETSSSSGQGFDIGKISGTANSASIFWDFPIEDTWNIKVFTNYRQFKNEGSAAVTGSSTQTDFEKDQTMLSLGMIFRIYNNANGNFWYSGGMEIAKVLSSKITFSTGTIVESEAGDIPLRILASAGIGYDFHLNKTWQLVLDISGGVIANDDPISLLIQPQVSLRRAF